MVATAKAITALEKGVGAGFLQTRAAQDLRTFIMNTTGLAATDATIEMLKQMDATMKSALSDGVKEEEAAIKTSDELLESKGQEVKAADIGGRAWCGHH